MKTASYFLWALSLLFFISCSDSDSFTSDSMSDNYSPTDVNTDYYEEDQQKLYDKSELDYDDVPDGGMDSPNETTIDQVTEDELDVIGKKIIKNADISLEVKDYVKDISNIKSTLEHFDCYITNESESNSGNYISNTLTIRVKSSQFDSLMNEILSGDGKITSKNIYVNDVTEQYVDIFQRLKNKKSIEKQYLELLKKAYTVNDVLNVTEYLRRIQEEIESSEGRLKYMDDQSNFSTITLNISYTGETIAYKETFLDKLEEGLAVGWQGVVYFIIAIFYLWPLWIVLGIIIFVVRRQIKKKKKSDKK